MICAVCSIDVVSAPVEGRDLHRRSVAKLVRPREVDVRKCRADQRRFEGRAAEAVVARQPVELIRVAAAALICQRPAVLRRLSGRVVVGRDSGERRVRCAADVSAEQARQRHRERMPETDAERVARVGRKRLIEVRLVEPLVGDARNRRRRTRLGGDLEVVAVEPQAQLGLPAVRHLDRVLQIERRIAAVRPSRRLLRTESARRRESTSSDSRSCELSLICAQNAGAKKSCSKPCCAVGLLLGSRPVIGVGQRQRLQWMRDRIGDDERGRRERRIRREVVAVAERQRRTGRCRRTSKGSCCRSASCTSICPPVRVPPNGSAKMPCAGMSCDCSANVRK